MCTRTTIALCAIIAASFIAGCGSPSAKSSPTENQPTSRPAGPVAGAATSKIPAGTDFGAGLTKNQVDEFSTVFSAPAEYAGRPVLVKAEVMDVCKSKGCWIKVTDGTHEARVKFYDYGFFLPKDCEGKTAWIEGEVTHRTVSVEELKHYAAESGTENPDDITEPLTVVGFMATGVRLTDQ